MTARGIYSLNSFIAAMLALWVAFSIGLPRPFWAMLTVYITAQPTTGALRSKAVFRVAGTFVGGVAAVIIVPNLVDRPLLMSLVVAAWVGFCLFVSLLDRTPRAYAFMLAGYTTAIIGFPSVGAPDAIFETALARVEEITLGIVCATLVHTIIFPNDFGQVLLDRFETMRRDAQSWIGDAFLRRGSGAERASRRRLATDVTELHVSVTHLPFDTSSLPLRPRRVRALAGRLAYMLPLISGIEDRLEELGDHDLALTTLLTDLVAWAETEASAEESEPRAEALKARCREMIPAAGQDVADWPTLLRISVLVRLQELIDALQDCRALTGAREPPVSDRLQALLRSAGRPRLHRDHGMAALSGLAVMVAIFACCVVWIETAWPEGAAAASMAGVFSCFYATQDDPVPGIVSLVTWITLGAPLTALYAFAILPAVTGFPMLVMALAPALLVIGLIQASPTWGPRGMGLLIGFIGSLGLQASYSANFPELINGALAQDVGGVAALATMRLMRTVGAGAAARRIARRGWADLAAIARDPRRRPRADVWVTGMLDRVGLISTRAALAEPMEGIEPDAALADMRAGLNMLELHELAPKLEPGAERAVDQAIRAAGGVFEARLAGEAPDGEGKRVAVVDTAIGQVAASASGDVRARGLAALVGLRRNLFTGEAAFARA